MAQVWTLTCVLSSALFIFVNCQHYSGLLGGVPARYNDVPWSAAARPFSSLYQTICQCSRVYRNRQLINVRPFEIAYVLSEQDCVSRCSASNNDKKMTCTSINYCGYDRRCELFTVAADQTPFTGKCIAVNGCCYYSVNNACLGNQLPTASTQSSTLSTRTTSTPSSTTQTTQTVQTTGVPITSFPTSFSPSSPVLTSGPSISTSSSIVQSTGVSTSGLITSTGGFIETTTSGLQIGSGTTTAQSIRAQPGRFRQLGVHHDDAGTHHNLPDKKLCPNGQKGAYARTVGYADARINIPNSKVQNIGSSSACQAECDKRTACQSYDYLANSKTCNLYNSVNKDPLQQEANVQHFDIICVPASIDCKGYIDRVPKKVQFSSPTTTTAISASDCINKCLSNKPCTSATYYRNTNKDNCLLSEKTKNTDPVNFLDKKMGNVDYYGLDYCTSTAGAKQKFDLNHDALPGKNSPSSVHKPNQANSNNPASSHIPNAKQFREMVIAAQKQKMMAKNKKT